MVIDPGEPYGTPTTDLDWNEYQSTAAEYAVSKGLNRHWPLGGPEVEADVGHKIQVRWTKHETGRLIVHNRDRDDQCFVLVTGESPVFQLRGWCWGREAKDDAHWNDKARCPAFFVSQDKLRPITVQRHGIGVLAAGGERVSEDAS